MLKKMLQGLFLIATTFNASAAIVSTDWKTTGDNLITLDTTNHLEWLDLTVTVNRSWNDIYSELGSGGEFEGWQMAGTSQLTQFFNEFGGDGYYSGSPASSTSIFENVSSYWGDTLCHDIGCNTGDGWTKFYTANIYGFGYVWQGFISDNSIKINSEYTRADTPDPRRGTALFRYATPVPIATPFWLLIPGFISFVLFTNRKRSRPYK